jgi:alpha-L-fucosidase
MDRRDFIYYASVAGITGAASALPFSCRTARDQTKSRTGKKEKVDTILKAKDWFHDQKWGIFVHYLYHIQNNPETVNNMGVGETSWDDCVNSFDVERFAREVSQTGARYVMFTLMQGSRYMVAPNKTYNRITGFKTGEACSTRDLVTDLIKALNRHNISLFLYFTGDGPYKDSKAGPAMGYPAQGAPLTEQFLTKWSSVAKEYSLRYGDRIKGWWVDGCRESLHYTDEWLKYYVDAMKAGNPVSLTAFNNGIKSRIEVYSKYDDYTCGEMTSFKDIPDARFINGSQWHMLVPLGTYWGKPGCKHDAAYLEDYLSKVNAIGGVVTIDVALYRDGHIDPEQLAVLKALNV